LLILPPESTGQSILTQVDTEITNPETDSRTADDLTAIPESPHAQRLLYNRIVLPLITILRTGASPRRLAWSIAIGLLIGINPLLGTATTLCLIIAIAFRLNLAASQLANYAVYPLQLLLLVPFLQLGSRFFHTAPIPLSSNGLLQAAKSNPVGLIRKIWLWELHALIVWAAISVVLMPLIATALTPLMRRLALRMHWSEQETEAA